MAVYTPLTTSNFDATPAASSATPSTVIVTVAAPSADVTWKPRSYNPFWVSSTRTRLTTGATVSTTIEMLPEETALFPAESVLLAVSVCVPWPLSTTVVAHLPSAFTTAVPTTVAPSSTVTVAPASPVPLMACVGLFVVEPVVVIPTVGTTVSIWIVVAALSLT